jgi:hypothetical protein
MKKITFLLLASFLLFSCEKPEIEDPQNPIDPPTVVKVTFTETLRNVTIFDGIDGKITITVLTGTPPYQYKIGASSFQDLNYFECLSAGTYKITVQDSKNQTATKDLVISQPGMPALVFTTTFTNVSIYGAATGSITVNVSTGVSPYSYSNGISTNSTGIFPNLSAGTYTITVTDNKQQVKSEQVIITQPARPLYLDPLVDILNPSTDLTSYKSTFEGKNKFSVSFWYNTTGEINNSNPGATLFFIGQEYGTSLSVNLYKPSIQYMRAATVLKYEKVAWSGLHHIVIIYTGTNISLYVDGELGGSVANSPALPSITNVYLGRGYGEDKTYAGTISKLKIYNDVLTLEDVNSLSQK